MGGTKGLSQKMLAACTEAFWSQCHKSRLKVLKYLCSQLPPGVPKLNLVSQACKGSAVTGEVL